MINKLTSSLSSARDKRIPSITGVTCTLRNMVCDPASGMDTTDPRTGVFTLVIDTGLVIGTLWVGDTLRLTLNVRVPSVIKNTSARGCPSQFWTFRIGTTWRWVAGLYDFYWSLCCLSVTLNKWISNKTRIADTNWYMISDIALGIDATQTRTRILTFSVDACFINLAILVYDTFWSTIWWWTNHFRQARTLTSISNDSWRVRVWSTRVGFTWIRYNWLYR